MTPEYPQPGWDDYLPTPVSRYLAVNDPFKYSLPCWMSLHPLAAIDLEELRVLYQTYKRECEEHYAKI